MKPMTTIQKTRLRARLRAALDRCDTVVLTHAVALANAGARLTDDPVDGMDVSVLLRGIGFNRDHDQPASAPIRYRRKVA